MLILCVCCTCTRTEINSKQTFAHEYFHFKFVPFLLQNICEGEILYKHLQLSDKYIHLLYNLQLSRNKIELMKGVSVHEIHQWDVFMTAWEVMMCISTKKCSRRLFILLSFLINHLTTQRMYPATLWWVWCRRSSTLNLNTTDVSLKEFPSLGRFSFVCLSVSRIVQI